MFYFPMMGYEHEQFPVWDMNMKISHDGLWIWTFSWDGIWIKYFPVMGHE